MSGLRFSRGIPICIVNQADRHDIIELSWTLQLKTKQKFHNKQQGGWWIEMQIYSITNMFSS